MNSDIQNAVNEELYKILEEVYKLSIPMIPRSYGETWFRQVDSIIRSHIKENRNVDINSDSNSRIQRS